jgi:hypothetical protein
LVRRGRSNFGGLALKARASNSCSRSAGLCPPGAWPSTRRRWTSARAPPVARSSPPSVHQPHERAGPVGVVPPPQVGPHPLGHHVALGVHLLGAALHQGLQVGPVEGVREVVEETVAVQGARRPLRRRPVRHRHRQGPTRWRGPPGRPGTPSSSPPRCRPRWRRLGRRPRWCPALSATPSAASILDILEARAFLCGNASGAVVSLGGPSTRST